MERAIKCTNIVCFHMQGHSSHYLWCFVLLEPVRQSHVNWIPCGLPPGFSAPVCLFSTDSIDGGMSTSLNQQAETVTSSTVLNCYSPFSNFFSSLSIFSARLLSNSLQIISTFTLKLTLNQHNYSQTHLVIQAVMLTLSI